MNENVIVKEYEFDNPLIQKMGSLINNSLRHCHNKYFHTFDHISQYDIQLANIGNSQMINLTISDKSMAFCDLNKNLTVACGNGLIFIQINKLTIEIHSNLSHINIHYYLKLQIPIRHRHCFRKLSQNPEYVQTHCNDRRSTFHFACRKWCLYINP